ncbi:hypothetical protein [Defluviitalea phaphyphila]|uniref:hypothetical protein n=1 Tax=Defluviitalea phaphyphila TaxID=1473580 RepID=UPI000730E2C6|nr:hypothetical protein [Defluviitalea phaphyphila]
MNEIKTQINILIDILLKKQKLLEEILTLTINQTAVLEYKPVDFNIFEKLSEEKLIKIKKINYLDEGFIGIYDNIKTWIQNNIDDCSKQIKTMQDLIYKISDLGVKINIQEEKNRKILSINSLKKKKKVIDIYKHNMFFHKK